MKKIIIILLFGVLANAARAQQTDDAIGIWRFTDINGEVRLRGYYRVQESTTGDVYDKQHSALYSAGLLLKTKSYVWTPKFLKIDIDGEVNPERSTYNYIVVPDQAEVRTIERLNAGATFFENKPISLFVSGHLDYGYSNRENLTNLKTHNQGWGSSLSYSNRILPLSVHYQQDHGIQMEVPGNRTFKMDESRLMGEAHKSFGTLDNNQFTYSLDNYKTQQFDLKPATQKIEEIRLLDRFYFDRKRNYRYSSDISNLTQVGTIDQKRFQVIEGISFDLTQKMNLNGNYSYYKYDYVEQSSIQNNLRGRLQYKFFESLTLGANGEYYTTNHTLYNEKITKLGFDLLYQKKLPTKGSLLLGYSFMKQRNDMTAASVSLQIFGEQHTLNDGTIALLNRAYVNNASIVVRSATGAIVYVQNLDYVIILHNAFTEIQRVPGGQIPNGALVLVDYTAIQPGSYKYDANNNNLSVDIMLFDSFLDIYYRLARQDFSNVYQTDNLVLNKFNENFYGIKLKYKMAEVGVEYDDYRSNVIPYKMTRYFVNLQGNLSKKIIYTVNGNIRDYYYPDGNYNQEFDDINGNMQIQTGDRSHVSIDAGYRYQRGSGIDLKLFTARTEYATSYRRIYFSIWLDFYKRTYLGDKLNFAGGTVMISRRF